MAWYWWVVLVMLIVGGYLGIGFSLLLISDQNKLDITKNRLGGALFLIFSPGVFFAMFAIHILEYVFTDIEKSRLGTIAGGFCKIILCIIASGVFISAILGMIIGIFIASRLCGRLKWLDKKSSLR